MATFQVSDSCLAGRPLDFLSSLVLDLCILSGQTKAFHVRKPFMTPKSADINSAIIHWSSSLSFL